MKVRSTLVLWLWADPGVFRKGWGWGGVKACRALSQGHSTLCLPPPPPPQSATDCSIVYNDVYTKISSKHYNSVPYLFIHSKVFLKVEYPFNAVSIKCWDNTPSRFDVDVNVI